MRISGLIVAAGKTEKEQNYKQMTKNGDLSAIERVVLNYQRAGIEDIVVVTGFQAKELEKSLRHYNLTFLRNDDYMSTQMFDSVKMGLVFLQEKCDRIMICPSDIPFIRENTLERIINTEGKLIYPVCDGQPGHPLCLEESLVKEILRYNGEGGLRGALANLSTAPVELVIQDEGVITEVDKTEDLEVFIDEHNSGLFRPEVRVRLANKTPFFGPGTVKLLRLIDHLESVKDACEKAGFSYSKGWTIIRTMERELGYQVVERQQGGKKGGQAFVNERGKCLLETFEVYEKRVKEASEEIFKEVFTADFLK